MQWNR